MIGINDLAKGNTPAAISSNCETILNTLKSHLPDAVVYVQSILPVISAKVNVDNNDIIALNDLIKPLADKYGFLYIDLYTKMVDNNNELRSKYTADGTHLMGNAYKIWADTIIPYIN